MNTNSEDNVKLTQYLNGGLALWNDVLSANGYYSLADRVMLMLTLTMHDKLAPNGGALTSQDLRQCLITTDFNSESNTAVMRTTLARLVKSGHIISFGELKKPYYARNPDTIPPMDRSQRDRVFASLARTSGSRRVVVDYNSRKEASDNSLYCKIMWRLPIEFVEYMHTAAGGFKSDPSFWLKGLGTTVSRVVGSKEGKLVRNRFMGMNEATASLLFVAAAARIVVAQNAKTPIDSWAAYLVTTLRSITEERSLLRDYLLNCNPTEEFEALKNTEVASKTLELMKEATLIPACDSSIDPDDLL